MRDQLLVRNVPHDVRQWIERQRQRNQMTQQEFVLSLLHQASRTESEPLLPFSEPPKEPLGPEALPFKFIDLFAGIGGFRAALGAARSVC
jgi:hypothetical protein